MTSLVLTDSSQLTADGFEKLPDQIMYPYAEPYDLQKHVYRSPCPVHVLLLYNRLPMGHFFVFHYIYSPEKELLHTTSAPKTTGGHNVSGVGITATSQMKPLLRILSIMSECPT
uniref:Uncharacterized protein n=1 Tax=Timema douglasi TaxID=61478 RepID=A0A7R8VSX0_TIMDO|nr:unnamed protein product [Timema douglasi]